MGQFNEELTNAYKSHKAYYKKLRKEYALYKAGKGDKPKWPEKRKPNNRAAFRRARNS